VRVLYWNKNAFEEVGLDPEKPPTTWEELEQYADKLDKQAADGSYERIGFHPLIGNGGVDAWLATNGGEFVSEDGEPQLNSEAAVETVQWVKDWVDRYGGWENLQALRGTFAAPPQDAFMSGKVAMYMDTNGYVSQLDFFRPRYRGPVGEEAELQFGITDLPIKEEQGSISGGFALSIPRGAPNPDAAWEFIKCATGPEAQASWARDTYSMPGNQQAANDPILLADPRWETMVNAMEYSSGGTYLEGYPNYKEQLDQRYENIWAGQIEPQAALDEAQQAVEAEIGSQ
jgi:multiple sugar transport system substrate-binding protein